MKEQSLKLWEILVPHSSNEGLEYSLEYHHAWDDYVRGLAGGLTILRSARGNWINSEGTTHIERMIPVRVYCTEETIDTIIDFTLQHYHQEAVFAYEVSTNVKVKRRE